MYGNGHLGMGPGVGGGAMMCITAPCPGSYYNGNGMLNGAGGLGGYYGGGYPGGSYWGNQGGYSDIINSIINNKCRPGSGSNAGNGRAISSS